LLLAMTAPSTLGGSCSPNAECHAGQVSPSMGAFRSIR
jgi:hypothetical protein